MNKLTNFTLLIAAYGVGQGSIFLVQTWLVSRGQVQLIAQFGFSFYLAILALLVVDWGALTVVARETARLGEQDVRTAAIWRLNSAAIWARLGIAVLLVAALVVAMPWLSDDFSRGYIRFFLPGLLAWSCNAAGLLDGLRMSGISGSTGALPYLFSAIALVWASHLSPSQAGSVLGGALSVGLILNVILNYGALHLAGHRPRLVKTKAADVITLLRDGLGALLVIMPGQLYFRFQLFISAQLFGPAVTGIFIYAKQAVTAFVQVVAFVRRTELPGMVALYAKTGRLSVRQALARQQHGTFLAATSTVFLAAAGAYAATFLVGQPAKAGYAILIFSPSLLTGALALSLTQAMLVRARYHMASLAVLISVVVGIATTLIVSRWVQIEALAIADLALNLVQAGVTLTILIRLGRAER